MLTEISLNLTKAHANSYIWDKISIKYFRLGVDWLPSSCAEKAWVEVRGMAKWWQTQAEHRTKASPCSKDANCILCCIGCSQQNEEKVISLYLALARTYLECCALECCAYWRV